MRFSSSAPVEREPGAAFAAARHAAGMLAAAGGTALQSTTPHGAAPEGASPGDTASALLSGTIGSLPVSYHVTLRLLAGDATTRTVRYRMRGRECAGQGDIDGLVELRISQSDTDSGAATLDLTADLDVRGRVARFGGQPLRDAVAGATARVAAALSHGSGEPGGDKVLGESVTALHADTAVPTGPPAPGTGTTGRGPGQPAPGKPSGWRLTVPLAAGALAIAGAALIRRRRKAGDDRAIRDHR